MGPIRFKGGEFAFIDWVRAQTRPPSGALKLGPGDDACVLDAGPDGRVSVTTDMLLEGTHFDLACVTPEEVGWKSVGVSLSDVAAMGMEAIACVAAVGLPESSGREFAEGLYRGMRALADRFRVPIAGGDVTSWDAPRVVVCVTALGRISGAEPVLRSGARPGDVILVTGELGGSILGRHVRFLPRLEEALKIARGYSPHAMIDVSDGLSSDLAHVAQESHVGAVIEESKIPVSVAARTAATSDGRTPLEHALNDGEDFELIVTMSEDDADRLLSDRPFQTKLTVIGRIVEGGELRIRGKDGRGHELEPGGYEHLRGGEKRDSFRDKAERNELFTGEAPAQTGLEVTTDSVEETVEAGKALGRLLGPGDVVALSGPLGAGKTWLTKGIALGLGVADSRAVRSPTFVLVSEYRGRLTLYHVDAYRLSGAGELQSLGSDEFMSAGGVTVVEWADRVKEALPDEHLWVECRHVGEKSRSFRFSAGTGRFEALVDKLASVL